MPGLVLLSQLKEKPHIQRTLTLYARLSGSMDLDAQKFAGLDEDILAILFSCGPDLCRPNCLGEDRVDVDSRNSSRWIQFDAHTP